MSWFAGTDTLKGPAHTLGDVRILSTRQYIIASVAQLQQYSASSSARGKLPVRGYTSNTSSAADAKTTAATTLVLDQADAMDISVSASI